MLIVIIFIAATLFVLISGILLMARGGAVNKKYGNKLMMMRVILQGIAILCIGCMYYFKHSGG